MTKYLIAIFFGMVFGAAIINSAGTVSNKPDLPTPDDYKPPATRYVLMRFGSTFSLNSQRMAFSYRWANLKPLLIKYPLSEVYVDVSKDPDEAAKWKVVSPPALLLVKVQGTQYAKVINRADKVLSSAEIEAFADVSRHDTPK